MESKARGYIESRFLSLTTMYRSLWVEENLTKFVNWNCNRYLQNMLRKQNKNNTEKVFNELNEFHTKSSTHHCSWLNYLLQRNTNYSLEHCHLMHFLVDQRNLQWVQNFSAVCYYFALPKLSKQSFKTFAFLNLYFSLSDKMNCKWFSMIPKMV